MNFNNLKNKSFMTKILKKKQKKVNFFFNFCNKIFIFVNY